MKKILSFILILSIMLVFTVCVCATEEIAEPVVEENLIDKAIDTLANSSIWISLGGVLVSIVSILGGAKFILNKLSNIVVLVKNKADKATISNALTETRDDIKVEIEKIKSAVERENQELKASNGELKKILVFLVSYSTNINPHAKNTMLAILSGAKIVTGDLAEFVAAMESEVKAEVESEIKDQTPQLDKIIGESEAK